MSTDRRSRDSGDGDGEQEESVYLGTRMGRQRQNAMQSMVRQATLAASGIEDEEVRQRVNAALPGATMFDSEPGRRELGMFHEDQQPTIWDAVNYPRDHEFRFESFYLRYERQAEARAIIDKPANDTWQSDPLVHDEKHDDEDEEKSDFEKEVKVFLEGEHTRRKPIHRLNVADRLGRLGHYSVIVIGTADGRELDTPLYEDEFNGLDDLNYLAAFAEDRIEDIDTDSDMRSERFRLPEMFEIITEEHEDQDEVGNTAGDYMSQHVHWSRVIHIPEGTLEDDLKGTPALKPVFHELLNIDKIKAASAEGYWRAGYQGLLIQPPEDPQTGQRMKFSDDGEGVEAEINEFLNNFQRTIATRGEVNTMDSSISDPNPHLNANYEAIAAALDLPKAILTGEDRADTASSEDVRQWHQKIGQRRNGFAEPVILEPLIQRLIKFGLLPEPEGDGFNIEWQPLDELSEQQEADLQSTKATTLETLSGGDPTRIASKPELRMVMGWGPEMGSEVNEEKEPWEEQDLDVDEEELPSSQQGGDSSEDGDTAPPEDDEGESTDGSQDGETSGEGESVDDPTVTTDPDELSAD